MGSGQANSLLRDGSHRYVRDTVSIDSTGEVLEVDTGGDKAVAVNIEGDATADYALDVGPDGSVYFDNEETYSGTSISDTFRLPDRYLRLRVTTAASSTDEATITVQVSK